MYSFTDTLNDEVGNIHIDNMEVIQNDDTKLNEGKIQETKEYLFEFMSPDSSKSSLSKK